MLLRLQEPLFPIFPLARRNFLRLSRRAECLAAPGSKNLKIDVDVYSLPPSPYCACSRRYRTTMAAQLFDLNFDGSSATFQPQLRRRLSFSYCTPLTGLGICLVQSFARSAIRSVSEVVAGMSVPNSEVVEISLNITPPRMVLQSVTHRTPVRHYLLADIRDVLSIAICTMQRMSHHMYHDLNAASAT